MMNTELTTNLSFEERMISKVKTDIGNLMTEEELSKIVHKAVNQIFFEKKVIKNHYGSVTGESPSLVELMVKDLVQPMVEKEVKNYVKNNEDAVKEIISEHLKAGFGIAVINSLNNIFKNEMYNFESSLSQRIQNLRN